MKPMRFFCIPYSHFTSAKILSFNNFCQPSLTSNHFLHLSNQSKNYLNSQRYWSASGFNKNYFGYQRIASLNEATKVISNLSTDEKKFVLEAIKNDFKKKEIINQEIGKIEKITSKQTKQLIIFNVFPFIGFGILDNMILIVAGQWINTTFGALLGISMMAAAALGNILSDIAGVGLSYYVELFVRKLGINEPSLLPEQAHSRKVRYIVNISRAIGLTTGCLIGMFPLLFF